MWDISPFAAFVFLVAGVLGFVVPSVKNLYRQIPIGNPSLWSIIFIVLGFVFGGLAYAGALIGNADVASAVGGASSVSAVSAASLDYCTYTAGQAQAVGVSIRTDTASQNRVFLDVDESLWNANATNTALNEANLTFSCVRSSDVDKAQAVKVVASGDLFGSEVSVSDSTQYSITERTTVPSVAWAGQAFTRTIYLADGAYASSSSDKELSYLTFAEGTKARTIGVRIEVDSTGYGKLNNYTMKTVQVSQASDNKKLAEVVINKLP